MGGFCMKQITPAEVEQLLAEGKDITILDVRETYEVAQGKFWCNQYPAWASQCAHP